jgi:lambda family phage minor tail protein L|tara:strand:- start:5978 stop:6574 length:597 start_codon:yes stop_codon:yes gene_type:complete
MTTIPVEQLQNLNGFTIIELFELQLKDNIHYDASDTTTTTLYRFHNGTNEINTDIIWQGNTYTAIACEAEGFETGDNTVMARPRLTFANSTQVFSTLLQVVNSFNAFNDLQQATVKRIRTLAQFLDDANFSGGSNTFGTADPDKELEQQEFLINKKIIENNQICSFELVNTIDFEDLHLPRLQITKDRFPAVGSFIFQ